MRPMYETARSLGDEQAVLSRLESAWGCVGKKLPIHYQVDFALCVEGEIKAWVEVKCRDKKYPEMWLSLHKVMAGVSLNKTTSLPFILVYGFGEEIYWMTVETIPEITMGGRTDRGDWQDIEPMAVFELSKFKRLS
jgi:hypothetical protein